jgi:hypothetical protein
MQLDLWQTSEVQPFVPLTESDRTVNNSNTPATRYTSLLKYFAVRLCVVVTLAVILLGAVEFYSYRRHRHAEQNVLEPLVQANLAEGASAEEREYWKEYEESNEVTYHAYTLWRLLPYRGQTIVVDRDGVRRTLYTQCDDKTFTIWMYGDSVMWGAGAPDGETIPSLVAWDYEKAGRPVCIVNYGEKGWSNTQEMIAMIEQLKHATRKPDIVLFYDGGTEAFAAYQSGQADVHSNFSSFQTFLDNWRASEKAGFSYFRHTNTYRFLEKTALRLPFHSKQAQALPAVPDTETLSRAVVENYVQNMDIVGVLAKHYGFRAIFTWYPNLAVGHKELTPSEQQVLPLQNRKFPGLGAMYQAVYKRGQELNRPDFYDLEDVLDDQKGPIYLGIAHLNVEGYQIVADRLFDIMEHPAAAAAANASSPVLSNRGK